MGWEQESSVSGEEEARIYTDFMGKAAATVSKALARWVDSIFWMFFRVQPLVSAAYCCVRNDPKM